MHQPAKDLKPTMKIHAIDSHLFDVSVASCLGLSSHKGTRRLGMI